MGDQARTRGINETNRSPRHGDRLVRGRGRLLNPAPVAERGEVSIYMSPHIAEPDLVYPDSHRAATVYVSGTMFLSQVATTG